MVVVVVLLLAEVWGSVWVAALVAGRAGFEAECEGLRGDCRVGCYVYQLGRLWMWETKREERTFTPASLGLLPPIASSQPRGMIRFPQEQQIKTVKISISQVGKGTI